MKMNNNIRLINADSIMRKVANMLNESGNPQLAEKAIALIDHEPTAFDVDLAIEDINESLIEAEGHTAEVEAYQYAIDIIKSRIKHE